MYWKFTYMWRCSACKDTLFVKADTEDEAYQKFNTQFGYEDVSIYNCEQVTEQEILKTYVVGYED